MKLQTVCSHATLCPVTKPSGVCVCVCVYARATASKCIFVYCNSVSFTVRKALVRSS